MISKIFMLLSASTTMLLGIIHLVYTFSGSNLLPRDPALVAAMNQAPLSITRETSVLRAWIGFNASHSMALILFGLIFGFLAFYHNKLLMESTYLQLVGLAMLVGFLVLAKFYWFSIPVAGVAISLLCYIVSVIAGRV